MRQERGRVPNLQSGDQWIEGGGPCFFLDPCCLAVVFCLSQGGTEFIYYIYMTPISPRGALFPPEDNSLHPGCGSVCST